MGMKYLVIMTCAQEGYWDTSGYCHWKKEAVFIELEFDLDDEEGLIKAIGYFKFQNPKGDVSLYKILDMSWDDSNDIIKKADPLIKQLEIEEEKAEKEKTKKEKELSDQKARARDLEQLKNLKEKYKGEI